MQKSNFYEDSRNKVNLDLSPKFRNHEEKVLTTGLRSVAQEEIRELFKKDAKSHLPALQLHKSRDVSHLKDLNSVRSLTSLVNLPTDIQTLRLLADPKSKKNMEKAKVCKKKNCVERVVSLSPDIEGFDLSEHGIPTGRKEAENLLKWFKDMKKKHGNTEEFDVVVLISGQEVLKQVRGQCKHLGIVLKHIFRHYLTAAESKKKKHNQEKEQLKLTHEAKIKKEAESHQEVIETLENKIKEQINFNEKLKSSIKDLQDDSNFYKTKLNEVQRLYLTEQDIWRKKSLELIRESVRRPSVITHESYKLAVARWRKDLFHDEIENQPSIPLPEVIREKLESEQPLSAEELRIYRELYYKAEEEKNLKRFSDNETQTDNKESLKDQENSEKNILEDSLERIGLNVEKTEKALEGVFDSKIVVFEAKEVQVDFDLDYQVDDDVLKELEKFLTIDEQFELLQLGEKAQSLNTSLESESSEKLENSKREKKKIHEDLPSNERSQELDNSEPPQNDFIDKSSQNLKELHQDTSKNLKKNNLDENLSKIQDESKEKSKKNQKGRLKGLETSKKSQKTKKTGKKHLVSLKSLKKSPDLNRSDSRLIKKKTFGEEEKNFSQTGILRKASLNKISENPDLTLNGPSANQVQEKLLLNDSEVAETGKISSKALKNIKQGKVLSQISKNLQLGSLIKGQEKKNVDFEGRPQETFNVFESNSLSKSITPEPVSENKIDSELKNLISQTSLSSNKQENDLSLSQAEIPAYLSNIKRRQTELIQSLIPGKLGPSLQRSTQALTRSIQEKKKELDTLTTEISKKQKVLLSLSSHLNLQHPPSPSSEKPKRVASARVDAHSSSKLNDSGITPSPKPSDFWTIDEESEDLESLPAPAGLDPETWKTGYVLGYSDGKIIGFTRGKNFASEELFMEGYAEAARELTEETQEVKKSQSSEFSSPLNRLAKKIKQVEVKSSKETTKILEFNFSNKKFSPRKASPVVYENVFTLLKKIPEFLKKKSKISRKMMFKMMTGFYENALYQMSTDGLKDMLLVCFDEIAHRYGLKKVSDRKFLEFIAEVIKNKELKRCAMFLKLVNFNSELLPESFSRFTLVLYLESFKYMMSSKIGIMTNFDETDDKILVPVNRAVECVREKLEGKVEKNLVTVVVNAVEHKSSPDPRRINTALVELEVVLEIMCETYENSQNRIKNLIKKTFSAFSQGEIVSNYIILIVMKTINPLKFNKFEEIIGKCDLSLEEISEVCINLNIFHESDWNTVVRNFNSRAFESYEDLLKILNQMKGKEKDFGTFSVNEWEALLISCKNSGSDELSSVLFQVYENELKRIQTEIFS
jgi:hypothetical protein